MSIRTRTRSPTGALQRSPTGSLLINRPPPPTNSYQVRWVIAHFFQVTQAYSGVAYPAIDAQVTQYLTYSWVWASVNYGAESFSEQLAGSGTRTDEKQNLILAASRTTYGPIMGSEQAAHMAAFPYPSDWASKQAAAGASGLYSFDARAHGVRPISEKQEALDSYNNVSFSIDNEAATFEQVQAQLSGKLHYNTYTMQYAFQTASSYYPYLWSPTGYTFRPAFTAAMISGHSQAISLLASLWTDP